MNCLLTYPTSESVFTAYAIASRFYLTAGVVSINGKGEIVQSGYAYVIDDL